MAAARFLIDHGADPANLTTVIPQRVMLAMGDVFGDGAESMLDASFDADEVAAMIEPYAGNNPSKPVWSGPIVDEYASAVRFTEEVRAARIGMIRSWGWSGQSAGGWWFVRCSLGDAISPGRNLSSASIATPRFAGRTNDDCDGGGYGAGACRRGRRGG